MTSREMLVMILATLVFLLYTQYVHEDVIEYTLKLLAI
jgi:hypothetical protein